MLAGEPLPSAQFYRTVDDGHPECGEWTHALLQVGPLWAIRDLHSIPSAPHSPWSTYTGARRDYCEMVTVKKEWPISMPAGCLSLIPGWGWWCHSKFSWMFPKQNSSGLLVPVLMILGLNIFTGSLPPLGKHTDRDQLLPLGSFDFPFSCGHRSLLMWLLHSNFWVISCCIRVAKSRDFIKKCVYACRHMCVHVHKGVKVCFHDFSCVHGIYVHVCTSV